MSVSSVLSSGSAGATTSPTRNDEASAERFLKLLVAQMQNQDPLSPMDNEAFVAQLAQFSTVSGITEMNKSLSTLAQLAGSDSRAAAPSWLGRDVTGSEGESGTVAEVGFAADGSFMLTLDSGVRLGVANVASIRKEQSA